MSKFKKVATTADVPTGEMKAFHIGHNQIIICNIEGKFYALLDECTHDSAPISSGNIQNNEVVCPRHGARFEIKSGAVKAPPALVPLDTYEVKIDGNDIYVKLED
ncbi:MAG: non-heme iron oxygenase ferredoxin subunit [candidate division Zixibacteria bacterium]|nr:non-heme iron oxygenase ferredoxin subunit [candidate division Zixibacteria bacterium]